MNALWRALRSFVFPLGIPLSWHQLASERKRFVAAGGGIAFAVMLMLFQLGLYDALFLTVVRPLAALHADLVIVSKIHTYLGALGQFPRRRLVQALAHPAVESVASVYFGNGSWKNPVTLESRDILIFGIRPEEHAFQLPEIEAQRDVLRREDQVLFDSGSARAFGPVPQRFLEQPRFETELGGKRIRIGGLFRLGGTFISDGNLVVGELAFFRLQPQYPRELNSIGLVRLHAGADTDQVADRLGKILPDDVRVLPKERLLQLERKYWAERTPIGFVITASMLVGLLVGAVIIYQILYADITDHLSEYATLKAIGFDQRFFYRLVLEQATVLSLAGFVPGTLLAAGLHSVTRAATQLPIELTVTRAFTVLLLSLLMCSLAGLLAMRRLSTTGPADLL
jgi:putative ABC transport system permease protein